MSAQEQLAPYLDRFVSLANQHATAKLEIVCKAGNVTVNITHDIGEIVKKSPVDISKTSSYSEALKKSANGVNSSQMKRLEKRAISRAEEARNAIKEQQTIAEDAKADYLRAKQMTEKVLHEAEEAKKETENMKLKAEKAKREAEKAKKEMILLESEAEEIRINVESLNQNVIQSRKDIEIEVTKDEDYFDCEHCCKEFDNKESLRKHTHGCPVCDHIFNEYPYCISDHIERLHVELKCDECGEYFMTKEELEMHKKLCFKCKNCHTYVVNGNELEIHKKKCHECDNCCEIFESKNKLKQHLYKRVSPDEENCAKQIEAKKKLNETE